MKKEAKEKVWLVAVVIDEQREIFGFSSQQNAQSFFDKVKEEVDEIYIAQEPILAPKNQINVLEKDQAPSA
jgi:hypothetical protein